MSIDELIEAKLYRLEELRKYQSYYGPNTPYPVIVEINELEAELRRLLQAREERQRSPVRKKKKKSSARPLWRMSSRTFDIVATIAFIGLIFLFGSIIMAAYAQTRPGRAPVVETKPGGAMPLATLRPTFTPTPDPNNPVAANGSEAQEAAITVIENSNLPPAARAPTQIATLVPTLTPSSTPEPTVTATPTETPLPPPTSPPPPRRPTKTPAPPTPVPAPTYPFAIAEQGNRAFQPTSYHVITIYIAVVSEGNIPLGDFKVVGDHVPSGQHIESGPSDWFWSVVNCLDCSYVKQGNLKLEPGTFTDGVWNIYLADMSGKQLSPVVPLSYSANPEQWVWDFIVFKRISG